MNLNGTLRAPSLHSLPRCTPLQPPHPPPPPDLSLAPTPFLWPFHSVILLSPLLSPFFLLSVPSSPRVYIHLPLGLYPPASSPPPPPPPPPPEPVPPATPRAWVGSLLQWQRCSTGAEARRPTLRHHLSPTRDASSIATEGNIDLFAGRVTPSTHTERSCPPPGTDVHHRRATYTSCPTARVASSLRLFAPSPLPLPPLHPRLGVFRSRGVARSIRQTPGSFFLVLRG